MANPSYLHRSTENSNHNVPAVSELEFVLVSSDYATMNAVSGGVKKSGAKFILAPTAEAARDCLNRRKVDGVFVDLEVPQALAIIEGVRKGTANNRAVIFACVADVNENTQALNAGPTFFCESLRM
jgi:DNA-binding response OmpR family regulator